jgi:hypothetical protein
MTAHGTQPIVGIEWFNLQCKAVIYIADVVSWIVSGKFIIFVGWRGSATYPTYVKM